MTDSQYPILFLSGAGLSPWIWDELSARVSADSVVAPRPAAHPEASLAAYVDTAVDAAPPGRFSIVAHSSGGVVGTELARRFPERVAAFLAISAVIPPAGGSFVSAMPAPRRWLVATAIGIAGTRPPATAIRRGVASGVPDDVAERVVADFTPESARLYTDSCGEHAWPARRGFLLTTQDEELSPALQRRFARRLGEHWSAELPTGHLPMLEDPVATAAAVDRFLRARR